MAHHTNGFLKCFLNANIKEEVYMVPSSNVSHNHWEVCKLKKALYGLKQALQAWFEKSTSIGIDVTHFPRVYLLSQSKYIVDILQQAQLTDT